MGGGAYPQRIRGAEVLPLRVSLRSGTNDLDEAATTPITPAP